MLIPWRVIYFSSTASNASQKMDTTSTSNLRLEKSPKRWAGHDSNLSKRSRELTHHPQKKVTIFVAELPGYHSLGEKIGHV